MGNTRASTRLFDRDFYLSLYPDVEAAGVDPFQHYVEHGWKEGRNPRRDFDGNFYLEQYPDVRTEGICPFIHYVEYGAAEGRLPHAEPAAVTTDAVTEFFDSKYYLERYADISSAEIDPLSHYISTGWREGRNPSANFDTSHYLKAYPEILAAGICPLIHYAERGKAEGRVAKPPHDPARERLPSAVPLSVQAEAWRAEKRPPTLEGCHLEATLASAFDSAIDRLVVALSHDDYAVNFGGIQNCIADEEMMCRDLGICYVHLCPEQPLPILSQEDGSDLLLRVKLNGTDLGTIASTDFARALGRQKADHLERYLVIHHLLGFSLESVLMIFDQVAPKETIYWAHDFFSLCPKYNLLRNDAVFCSAPPLDSTACTICSFGDDRSLNLKQMALLFERIEPNILAPSKTTLDFWRSHTTLKVKSGHVVPHGVLVPAHGDGKHRAVSRSEKRLRVAFIGAPVYHKGWSTFKALAEKLKGDERYTFLQLGALPDFEIPSIVSIKIMTTRDQRDAMTNAIRALDIDVALVLSVWPETFCFTAHEAIAGGAFLVAAQTAGHAAVVASDPSLSAGIVVADDRELNDIFEGPALQRYVQKRSNSYAFKSLCGTIDWITGQAQ